MMRVHMRHDPIAEAREYVKQAIAELKAAGVKVPMALHKAAHALSYAVDDELPAVSRASHYS
jgi:hypothetical protein